jgi:hypothetical protein
MGSLVFYVAIFLLAALWMTQPLTEMSTNIISWRGIGCQRMGLTILPFLSANCLDIQEASTS